MDYLKKIEELEKKVLDLTSELSELKIELQADEAEKRVSNMVPGADFEEPYISKTVTDGGIQSATGHTEEPKKNATELGAKALNQGMAAVLRGESAAVQGTAASMRGGSSEIFGQTGSADAEAKQRNDAVVQQKEAEPKNPEASQKRMAERKTDSVSKEKLSLEEKVGGKLMGMVAAVLVFIGLILFGTIVYETLGDAARVVLLFLVSTMLLAGGILLHRKKQSWFSLSLTGCGYGAMYLSLFMTRVVFNLITTEVLYGLLFVWFVGIGLFVWKYHSQVVAFLGLLGITISVLFGTFFLEEGSQYLFLVIYFVVLSALYLWMILGRYLPKTREQRYPKLLLTAMFFQVICALLLSMRFETWYKEAESLGAGILVALLLSLSITALPIIYHLRDHAVNELPIYRFATFLKARTPEEERRIYDRELSWIIFGWYQLLSGLVLAYPWSVMFSESSLITCLLILLFSAAIWGITEYLGVTGTENYAASVVFAGIAFFASQAVSDNFQIVVLLLLAAVFAGTGFFGCVRKHTETKYGKTINKVTALVLVLFAFFNSAIRNYDQVWLTLTFVCCALLLAGFFALLFLGTKEEMGVLKQPEHADALKILAYLEAFCILTVFLFLEFIESFFSNDGFGALVWLILVLAIVNSIAFYSRLCKKVYQPEKTDRILSVLTFGINQLFWVIGMVMLHAREAMDSPIYFVVLLLLTLALCVAGMKRFYEKITDKTFLGVYLGLRVTIYVLVVITVIRDIPGFVVSCVLIVVALAAIIAGFKISLSSLRMYGLVLTMLAVLKLMMLDVRHDNSLETVGCFLIAGILCFCINLVYNKVKKYVEEQ